MIDVSQGRGHQTKDIDWLKNNLENEEDVL